VALPVFKTGRFSRFAGREGSTPSGFRHLTQDSNGGIDVRTLLFLACAAALFGVLVSINDALHGLAFIAFGLVFAVCTRIVQAERHHDEMMRAAGRTAASHEPFAFFTRPETR
jgi:hypothetical protein